MIILMIWKWEIIQVLGLMVGSILMPNRPFASESIVSLSDLDVETKIAWEVLKIQLILSKKA
jgi:hypothetical protein